MALCNVSAADYNVVNVLQIWMHADQRKTGFLDRTEFFNALRLVTVAQSKRELTPDIVKAALYGPAAAKIPAPQINLSAIPALQSNSMAITSAPQMGLGAPAASQNFGFRGPGAPNAGVNQNYFPQQNQSVRPPQTMPTGTATPPLQAMPNVTASHLPQAMPSGTASRPLQAMSTVTASHPSQAMLTGTGSRPPQAIFTGTGSHPPQPLPTGTTSQPPQAMPTGTASRPPQGISGGTMTSNFPGSNVSNDWFSGGTGAAPSGSIGVNPAMPSSAPKPQATVSTSSQSTVNDYNALTVSGNGFTSTSGFGNDLFSTKPSPAKEEPSKSTYSESSASASSPIVPVSSVPQPSSKSMSLDSVLNGFSMQPAGSQFQRPQSPLNPSQQVSALGSSSSVSSGIPSVGTGSSSSDNSQLSWPKMKPADVQKYTKVFMEVDTDRDGKITGEQARNLFLSWRLPRGRLFLYLDDLFTLLYL